MWGAKEDTKMGGMEDDSKGLFPSRHTHAGTPCSLVDATDVKTLFNNTHIHTQTQTQTPTHNGSPLWFSFLTINNHLKCNFNKYPRKVNKTPFYWDLFLLFSYFYIFVVVVGVVVMCVCFYYRNILLFICCLFY